MKAKKGKNVSVQISLYSVFDQISNIEYLQQFKNDPQFLAAQIDDLKTLLQFSASNYTQKARNFLNLSKQFTKSIETNIQAVNQIDMGFYNMPQSSYPQLAYETLKRGTSLQLQQDGNQQLDWRAVQTEFQLKFLESKNLQCGLQWEKCYNPQQRCIQINKNTTNKAIINGNMFQRQQQINPVQVDLSLNIQKGFIVWDVKKVIYQNNVHYGLISFYRQDLMARVREQNTQNIQQSDKYVLSLIYKSLDYIDVILLYIQLKNAPYNQNIEQADKKNAILNLFDPNQSRFDHFKSKSIKVYFILPFSNIQPSIILRVDGLNVLKIQFTKENEILFTIKLKNKKQEMTLKKLKGSIKNLNFSLKNLIDITEELLQSLKIYENFVEQKAQKFRLDIFLSNRTTYLIMYFKNIHAILVEQDVIEDQKVNEKINEELAQGNIQFSGIYLVFKSKSVPSMPAMVSLISYEPDILLKSSNTLSGFINRILKSHQSMTFQQAMYHLHYYNIIQEAQQKSNWKTKLIYCDIYVQNKPIVYKFKTMPLKKQVIQSSIIKKDPKQEHLSVLSNQMKDYNINVKIAQNFKTVQFIFVNLLQPAPNESEIPQKYFKQNWRQYIKKRNDSQVLKNEYLDPYMILKATHYVINHLQFNRYVKPRAGIFKTQQRVNLMDQ